MLLNGRCTKSCAMLLCHHFLLRLSRAQLLAAARLQYDPPKWATSPQLKRWARTVTQPQRALPDLAVKSKVEKPNVDPEQPQAAITNVHEVENSVDVLQHLLVARGCTTRCAWPTPATGVSRVEVKANGIKHGSVGKHDKVLEGQYKYCLTDLSCFCLCGTSFCYHTVSKSSGRQKSKSLVSSCNISWRQRDSECHVLHVLHAGNYWNKLRGWFPSAWEQEGKMPS